MVGFRAGTLQNARFSHDGQTIIFSGEWEGGPPQVSTTRIGTPESRALSIPSATLATILGDISHGSLTTLLIQGFTQNANYAKAQVDAQSQLVDGALTSHARFERDMRNAQIRDEHTTSSLHCTAIDAGQTITASSGSSWKVAQSISDVADNRGEAGPNQPAFYG